MTRLCRSSGFLWLNAKHWRMVRLKNFPIAEIHVHTTRQAGIETADRAHDVDAFEFVRAVFFEDRRVLHRIFVGARRAVNVSGICVPGRRRIRMIVGNLMVLNHDVM